MFGIGQHASRPENDNYDWKFWWQKAQINPNFYSKVYINRLELPKIDES